VVDENAEAARLPNRLIRVADGEDVDLVDRSSPDREHLERTRPIEILGVVVDVYCDVHCQTPPFTISATWWRKVVAQRKTISAVESWSAGRGSLWCECVPHPCPTT
jgi:hypothetical protein